MNFKLIIKKRTIKNVKNLNVWLGESLVIAKKSKFILNI